MKARRLIAAGVLLYGMVAVNTIPAHADSIFTVTLNTSSLAGPYSLAFQLTDGSLTGDGNNTATISNFSFGAGGSGGSTISSSGGASGNFVSGVNLTDSSFFNSFSQDFTPGSSLSFLVDLTTNADAGGTPDAFAFSILDSSGNPIPTLDPLGADTLLSVDIDSANPTLVLSGTDSSRTSIVMDAPTITPGTPGIVPVPEPTSLLLMAMGVAAMVMFRWRHVRGSETNYPA